MSRIARKLQLQTPIAISGAVLLGVFEFVALRRSQSIVRSGNPEPR